MLFQYNPNSLFSLHGSFDLLFFPSSAVTAETMRRGWSKCHLSGPWVQTIWIKICLKIKNLPLKYCYLPKDALFLSGEYLERDSCTKISLCCCGRVVKAYKPLWRWYNLAQIMTAAKEGGEKPAPKHAIPREKLALWPTSLSCTTSSSLFKLRRAWCGAALPEPGSGQWTAPGSFIGDPKSKNKML